jgi:hypothetical protein
MKMIKKMLLSLLAVVLILEEWLWDSLTALGAYFSRILHLQKFEHWLEQAPPKTALMVFMLPILIVTPINLLGLLLIAHGLVWRGLLVELVAKLLGTLLVARVFRITKKQMLQFGWFCYLYEHINALLVWAHMRVTSTPLYQKATQLKAKIYRQMKK